MLSDRQYKILFYIERQNNLFKVFNKFGFTPEQYMDFQECFPEFGNGYLVFSDSLFDENTTVSIGAIAQPLLDTRKREIFRTRLSVAALILAVPAYLMSLVSLVHLFIS